MWQGDDGGRDGVGGKLSQSPRVFSTPPAARADPLCRVRTLRNTPAPGSWRHATPTCGSGNTWGLVGNAESRAPPDLLAQTSDFNKEPRFATFPGGHAIWLVTGLFGIFSLEEFQRVGGVGTH